MKKLSNLGASSIAFLISVVLFIATIGLMSLLAPLFYSDVSAYVILALGTIIPMGIGLVIYLVISRQSLKQIWGNKVSGEQVALSLFLALFTYPVVVFIQTLWMLLLYQLGIAPMTDTLPPTNTPLMLLLATFSVALLPALFEEILFRGILQKNLLRRRSAVFSILIASLLFMLMHGSLQALPYTFILGVMLGYLSYRSGSLLPPVIYHFANNSIALLIQYVTHQIGDLAQSYDMDSVFQESTFTPGFFEILPLMGAAAVCAGICFVLILLFNKVSPKRVTIGSNHAPLRIIEWLPLLLGGLGMLGVMLLTTIIYLLI